MELMARYTIDDGAIIRIDGIAFECIPPDIDPASVTLDQIVDHLNTQAPRGSVQQFSKARGGITWIVRPLAAGAHEEIVDA